jgi:DNA-binding NarL/FixJ family response regulator
LRETIEEDTGLRVVIEVGNGQEALDAIEQFNPDIAVLDVDMPVMNGFDVARTVQKRKLATAIVFITMHRDEDLFNEGINLGAKGFVLKDSALTDIIECIKTVARSDHYASHALTSFLINRSQRAFDLAEREPSLSDLSPTERLVLKLIAEDKTSKEIGEQLFISPRTVEKHRENICQKLKLHGSHSLYKFALSHRSELF